LEVSRSGRVQRGGSPRSGPGRPARPARPRSRPPPCARGGRSTRPEPLDVEAHHRIAQRRALDPTRPRRLSRLIPFSAFAMASIRCAVRRKASLAKRCSSDVVATSSRVGNPRPILTSTEAGQHGIRFAAPPKSRRVRSVVGGMSPSAPAGCRTTGFNAVLIRCPGRDPPATFYSRHQPSDICCEDGFLLFPQRLRVGARYLC
jgi:hypothetical protein